MSSRREILVGVVVVAGVLVGIGGTLWLQGASLARNTIFVEALFTDVGQLMDGNAVKYRGVNIGRVSGISVEPDGQSVRVSMRIDAGVAFPADPGAVSSPESMFGDWQIDIVDRDNPNYRSYRWHESDSAAIPGYALPDISELTATAQVIAENLQDISDRVRIAFTQETAENLAQAIDNLEIVSSQIAVLVEQQATTFAEMTEELRIAAAQVGDAAGTAQATFARVDTLLGQEDVDSLVTDIRDLAANLRVASDELSGAAQGLRGTLQRADTTFAVVNRIASQIENGEGGIGRLVGDSSLVVRAEGALAQLNLLLEDLRVNPKRYFRLSIF